MSKLIINGGKSLNGNVKISGSKNAVLPIISACLLCDTTSKLENVPDIEDVQVLLKILEFLGAKINFKNSILTIDPKNLQNKEIPHQYVSKMRGSIILLAPLLLRFKEVKISFPGGCVLGKRPIDSHLHVFSSLGAEIVESTESINLQASKLIGTDFCMSEMSVTATENAILAASLAEGKSTIRLAASEPHVQDLCYALESSGVSIKGIGTHKLEIQGQKNIKCINHIVTSDYLEIGTYAIAAAITNGHVTLENVNKHHLDIFWLKMHEAGVRFTHSDKAVEIVPSLDNLQATNIKTAVFPGFPTDLQAQFAVLLTQANGKSQVFETLFDGKMNYIFELEKMKAHVSFINNHQIQIHGPTQLLGTQVASLDIRAGAAMVIAALAAGGQTEISNVKYIYRGYSNMIEKLKSLGADIKKSE